MQWCTARMNLEDSFPSKAVGERNGDMTIKATRTKQRSIEYVDTVCCRQDYDCLAAIESIKFDQQLIERLISLVIPHYIRGALATDGIKFINENDRWGRLPRLVEKCAHP